MKVPAQANRLRKGVRPNHRDYGTLPPPNYNINRIKTEAVLRHRLYLRRTY